MWILKKKYILNVLCIVTLLLFVGVAFIQSARRAVGRVAGDFFFPFLALPVKGQQELANKSLLLESKSSLAGAVEKSEKLNLRLSAELSASSSLMEENSELRKLLKLKKRVAFKFQFAEIILRDPTVWEQRFTVDKGSDYGIKNGDVVVTGVVLPEKLELAVVGRISNVTGNSAEVTTLVSSENRISVMVPANDSGGILHGGFRYGSQLFAKCIYLPRDFNYTPGMKVITSGLSRTTPPGLYIGKISGKPNSIRINKNLYKEVDVELPIDLNSIHFVMIITGG